MNSGALQAGMKLNFSSPALNGTIPENVSRFLFTLIRSIKLYLFQQLSCKIVTGGLNASLHQSMDGCMVPASVTGPMYVFITKDNARMATKGPSNMNGTINSSLVVAGPALLFVNQPDFIGSLIRPGFNVTGATSGNHTAAVSTSPFIVSKTSPMTGMQIYICHFQIVESFSQGQPQRFQSPYILLRRRRLLSHRWVLSQLQYPRRKLVPSCPV